MFQIPIANLIPSKQGWGKKATVKPDAPNYLLLFCCILRTRLRLNRNHYVKVFEEEKNIYNQSGWINHPEGNLLVIRKIRIFPENQRCLVHVQRCFLHVTGSHSEPFLFHFTHLFHTKHIYTVRTFQPFRTAGVPILSGSM